MVLERVPPAEEPNSAAVWSSEGTRALLSEHAFPLDGRAGRIHARGSHQRESRSYAAEMRGVLLKFYDEFIFVKMILNQEKKLKEVDLGLKFWIRLPPVGKLTNKLSF